MSDPRKPALITHIRENNPPTGGQTVGFVFTTSDGVDHAFEAPHGSLSSIVLALQECGRKAVAERVESPFGKLLLDNAAPMIVRGSANFGQVVDGSAVVVRFSTMAGIPVMLSMDKDQAVETGKSLLERAAKLKKLPGAH